MSSMFSMTGFARAETGTSDFQLIWEIKTVNHRYLETSFKLPESLKGVEPALRERARVLLGRGKLDAVLKLEGGYGGEAMTVNRSLLKNLIESAKDIALAAPDAAPITQGQLMAWPGVLIPSSTLLDDIAQATLTLFDDAMARLIDSRAEEGAKLHKLLLANLDAIAEQLQVLEPIANTLPQLQQRRLQERVDALETKVDEDRLAQEVALLAQKADVREELDRLSIHVDQARSLINADGPHGRRLDFLTQELNREANTLGAKAICSEVSNASIELKVIIEQIREQVQNIQ
ncbi:MAG: YicC/YloC family endoribonuclease [Gammaproteobacteria bacterium]